jgi:hypothetical protein
MMMNQFSFFEKTMILIFAITFRLMLLVQATTAIMNYFDTQTKETACFDVVDDHGSTVSECFSITDFILIDTLLDNFLWVICEQAYILPSLMSPKKPAILPAAEDSGLSIDEDRRGRFLRDHQADNDVQYVSDEDHDVARDHDLSPSRSPGSSQTEEAPLSTCHDEGRHNDGCAGATDDDATKSKVVSVPPVLRRSARIAKLARVNYSGDIKKGSQKLRRSVRLATLPQVNYRSFL